MSGERRILNREQVESEGSLSKNTLSLDAFVRSFAVNRGTPHALLLGAGSSISSGVSSAEQCIWDWKRSIFLSHHPGLEKQFGELSLAGVRERIQSWLDSAGEFPAQGDANEYGIYIEKCYPIEEDRRRYFDGKIHNIQPHFGYRFLCFLAELRMVRSVWTTNFDGLTAKAAAGAKVTAIEVGIDCAQKRLSRQGREGELLCVSLHGDYRYDPLKNTPTELKAQDQSLREALVAELQDVPCICVGYSGRDASVMDALKEAYTKDGAGSLYWCTYGDETPAKPVVDLINAARAAGRKAYIVSTNGFDDLMVRLSRHAATDKERSTVSDILGQYSEVNRLQRQSFSLPNLPTAKIIKSNAFAMDCPGELYTFDLQNWPETGAWKWLREQVTGRPISAVPFKGKVLSLATIEELKSVFGENIKGQIQRTPVQDSELQFEDGAVVSLMGDALTKALADEAGLHHDGRRYIWERQSIQKRMEGGQVVSVFDAVELSLRRIKGQQYLVLMPTLHVENLDGSEVDVQIIQKVRFQELWKQRNSEFNDAVNKWRNLILKSEKAHKEVEFPPGVGSSFKFRVRRSPVFAEIGDQGRRTGLDVSSIPGDLRKHKGVEISEPKVLFCQKNGNGLTRDTHSLRGILENRPYDFSLTKTGLDQNVRLGVICPAREEQQLHSYLHQAMQAHQRSRANAEYILDFPGFQQAFGLPVEIPSPGSACWVRCPEPKSVTAESGSPELGQLLTTAVNQIRAAAAPDVVIVYVPDRWSGYRGFRTESERFDLHDFVKAFCVQKGIATQFLNEDTLRDSDQCRVWWWLSLALYVKSMRTPWVLESLDEDTAFVGIGFSVDPTKQRGRHVVLGCSHIYSATGEGLQYRLSKVEQPKIIRGNPFMSEDDARRLGETIRHLFYESRSKLPRRVVLHKRTPFRREEREGLGQGLAGVEEIDMLEIGMDSAMRYVASWFKDGKPKSDNFPVRRGTTVQLDDFTALTWVHGVTDAVTQGRKYFQGGRRIPTPLVIRRHAGQTSLEKLAFEILGLSKMNWNNFDMYTKLPATLQSSGEIAKIGSLLERFGSASYDFRLFM